MSKHRRLRSRRRRTSRWLFFWMPGLLLCALIALLWIRSAAQSAPSAAPASPVAQTTSNQVTPAPIATLEPGLLAPDLTLSNAQGGMYHLADHRGQVIILTFLATQPDTQASTSRSQAVSLLSMQHQYRPKGVSMVLIDESSGVTRQSPPTLNELLNVTYDWNLGTMPLLVDDAFNTAARHYGIQRVPTTLLINAGGQVVQRWGGEVLPAQLGLALQKLVGASS